MSREHILIIGAGSMGGGMTELFSEHGSNVSLFDKDEKTLNNVLERAAKNPKLKKDQVKGFQSLKALLESSPKDQAQRIMVLSLPHGHVVDTILQEIEPLTSKGDIVMDCDNEEWMDTERRQKRCESESFGNGPIHWMGVGVSGGYQSARRGPSLCPGGSKEAYDAVEHLLKAWAAKDSKGTPCVQYMGKGGAGHQVKCLHNGIEQGMLSAICEVYTMMRHTLDMTNDEISDVLNQWATKGTLAGDFLVQLGAEVISFKKGDAVENKDGIVDDIEDKVTQDADDSEGTGVWSMIEFGIRHVSAPTIAAAHCLRLVSAEKGEREEVVRNMQIPQPSKAPANVNKKEMVEKLHEALYATILASFVQGLNVIARATRDEDWGVSLEKCIQIWRAGCIVQSDAIADMLEPIYHEKPDLINLLLSKKVCEEFKNLYAPLKEVIQLAVQVDAVVPSLSATLEYLKSVAGQNLPTNMQETVMDAFGHHNYDLKSEHKTEHKKGSHHTEFRPA